jgi:hypothetical protein
MLGVELPQKMKDGIYMLDCHLDLAHDGIATWDDLHQDIVEFLTRYSAPRA